MRLRGHHLLCVLGFQGKGYSPGFVENMTRLVDELRSGRDVDLEIGYRHDDICAPCPKRGPDGCVAKDHLSEWRVAIHDARVMHRLGLQPGQRVRWSEVQARIRQRMAPEDLQTLCKGCPWLPLGVCADGIRALKVREEQTVA